MMFGLPSRPWSYTLCTLRPEARHWRSSLPVCHTASFVFLHELIVCSLVFDGADAKIGGQEEAARIDEQYEKQAPSSTDELEKPDMETIENRV